MIDPSGSVLSNATVLMFWSEVYSELHSQLGQLRQSTGENKIFFYLFAWRRCAAHAAVHRIPYAASSAFAQYLERNHHF
jgi:hypothetical protein